MQNWGSGRGHLWNGHAPSQNLWPPSLGILNVLQCSTSKTRKQVRNILFQKVCSNTRKRKLSPREKILQSSSTTWGTLGQSESDVSLKIAESQYCFPVFWSLLHCLRSPNSWRQCSRILLGLCVIILSVLQGPKMRPGSRKPEAYGARCHWN